MDRREFLKSTGAAAAAATTATAVAETTLAAPAVAKGLQQLRLAMPWADGVAGPADQAHRLAQRIASMSGGKIRLVPSFGVANGLAAVHAGEADLYFASTNHNLDAHRGLAFFAGLPGDRGLAPHHLQSWVTLGGGQALWDELAGDLGIKPLLAAHTGSRSLMLATESIDTMSALTGRKAYVEGLARDVARGLGLEPVSMAPAQLAAAMQNGELLAAECGGAITVLRARPARRRSLCRRNQHQPQRNGPVARHCARPVGPPRRIRSGHGRRRRQRRIPAVAGRGGGPPAHALPGTGPGAHLAARR